MFQLRFLFLYVLNNQKREKADLYFMNESRLVINEKTKKKDEERNGRKKSREKSNK